MFTRAHHSRTFTRTTLTIDNLVFTLRCVYNRCSWFVLFVPCTRLMKRGRKLVHEKIKKRKDVTCCVCVSLSLSFLISKKVFGINLIHFFDEKKNGENGNSIVCFGGLILFHAI